MQLRDWLYQNKISVRAFAKQLSVSRNHMSGIINGYYKAGKRLVKDIGLATEGKVKDHELADQKEEKS